jgi:hypothetical protein
VRFQNISCIVITLNWSIIFIFNIDSSWLFFLLNNIKFSEALFFFCLGTVSYFHQKSKHLGVNSILKNHFVSVGGFHSLRLKRSSNRIWLKNSSEIQGKFSHWCRIFKNVWGGFCFKIDWAKTALVASRIDKIDIGARWWVQSSM